MADSVNSQLSPQAVSREIPLFSKARFRRVLATAALGQKRALTSPYARRARASRAAYFSGLSGFFCPVGTGTSATFSVMKTAV